MKKLISLILCLLLAAAFAAPALADVIWAPTDAFYEMHRDECVYTESRYEAQSDTKIQKSPEDDAEVGAISAGDVVEIDYVWNDWGYVELPAGDLIGGWVDLSAFRKLYGSAEFAADHADGITEGPGTVSRGENGTICVWAFPGSGELIASIDSGTFGWAEDDPAYDTVWTDEDGAAWGHLTYYYGIKNGWINLSDPGADDLPATAPRYADGDAEAPADTGASAEETSARVMTGAPVLVIVVVAVVVVAAAAVIIALTRKKK